MKKKTFLTVAAPLLLPLAALNAAEDANIPKVLFAQFKWVVPGNPPTK